MPRARSSPRRPPAPDGRPPPASAASTTLGAAAGLPGAQRSMTTSRYSAGTAMAERLRSCRSASAAMSAASASCPAPSSAAKALWVGPQKRRKMSTTWAGDSYRKTNSRRSTRRAPPATACSKQLVQLALAESPAARAGGECALARLSELLFVELVRRYVETLPPENVGWLAGLRNESVVARSAGCTSGPAHPWSLDELAREVGLSRSVLAERFAHLVGVPPMQYLAQRRMQLAASLLASSSIGLSEIAERVGYGSEAALSRAFRRWVGMPAADWRRGRRGELALT